MALMMVHGECAIQRFVRRFANLAKDEQNLLVHLQLSAPCMCMGTGARTHELSDTEMTRGASNEDLLAELCGVLDVVVDRPCVLVSYLPRRHGYPHSRSCCSA